MGDYDDRNIPTLVLEVPNNVIQISAGRSYSLCLTNDGHIYSFGRNQKGQLGLGNYDYRNNPTLISEIPNNIVQISAGDKYSLCLTNAGEIYAWGKNMGGQLGLGNYNNRNIPTLVPTLPNNIIQIEAGNNHSLVLSSSGKIYAFGYNISGQLGLGKENKFFKRNIPTLIPKFNVLS